MKCLQFQLLNKTYMDRSPHIKQAEKPLFIFAWVHNVLAVISILLSLRNHLTLFIMMPIKAGMTYFGHGTTNLLLPNCEKYRSNLCKFTVKSNDESRT